MDSQGLIIKKSVPNEPIMPNQPKKTLLKSGKRKILNKIPYLSKINRKPVEMVNKEGNTITTEKTERRKDGSIVKTIIEINGNQKKTTTIITKGNFTSTNTNVEFINDEEANNCLNNFNNNNSNNDINNNFFNINGFSNNENYNNNIKKKELIFDKNQTNNNNNNYNINTINQSNYSQNSTNSYFDNNDYSEDNNNKYYYQQGNYNPNQRITYSDDEEEEESDNSNLNKYFINPQSSNKTKERNFQNQMNPNFQNQINPNFQNQINPNFQNSFFNNLNNINPNFNNSNNEYIKNSIRKNPEKEIISPLETENNIYSQNTKIKNTQDPKENSKNKLNSLLTFQEDALNKHNKYREKHHSPNLILNEDLCKIAQEYADLMSKSGDFSHSNNEYRGEILGENIFYCYGTPINGNEMTDDWYNEIKYYNFNNPGFNYNTGHFTQVIWANSKIVGFGFSQSSDGGFYGVANYFPAGNLIGDFDNNVLPP